MKGGVSLVVEDEVVLEFRNNIVRPKRRSCRLTLPEGGRVRRNE